MRASYYLRSVQRTALVALAAVSLAGCQPSFVPIASPVAPAAPAAPVEPAEPCPPEGCKLSTAELAIGVVAAIGLLVAVSIYIMKAD